MQKVTHITTHPAVAAALARRKGSLFLDVCALVTEADLFAGRISFEDYKRSMEQIEQMKGEVA